jgi:hypothetical protein
MKEYVASDGSGAAQPTASVIAIGRFWVIAEADASEQRNPQRRSIECRQRLGGLLKYYSRAA